MTTKIYAVFPGVGKTHFVKNICPDALDIDSSHFDKKHFPDNYLNHIKRKLGESETILVTCHEEIINRLLQEKLDLILVYPKMELKEEYMQRFRGRNDAESFVRSLSENWDTIITRLEAQQGVEHIVVKSGEYLSDVICCRSQGINEGSATISV
jgi:hypothetical protein